MKYFHPFYFFLFLLFFGCNRIQDSKSIIIQTDLGIIEAELFTEAAPLTSTNFLNYIDMLGDQGGEFYRTVKMDNQANKKVKIEVIQGGFKLTGTNADSIKSVLLERTNQTGIRHLDGTLSMARDDPDSGSTEFFICIGDQPSLDFGGTRNPDGQGFAAFGIVTKGMDVVRKIQNAPSKGQELTPGIRIIKIYRK